MGNLCSYLNLLRLFMIGVSLLFSIHLEGQVMINEVCSSNSTIIADPDYGKFGDWIELYNDGDEWINIGGWILTDDTTQTVKWAFPPETYIGPKGFKVVFADSKGSKLHTNFSLNKDGEFLALYDSKNLVDSLHVPYLLNDRSYGRLSADKDIFSVFIKPSPDAANIGTSSLRIASFVEFSIKGGFYSGSQKLALTYPSPDMLIYYTTDGSYPNKNSLVYTDTLLIEKTTVIRAICFEPGTLTGVAVTHTYFIDEQQNLPVFSMVTDSVHLFSDETGIMVEGTAGVSGYCTDVPHNLNQDWERPVNLEFFEDDGSVALNQICGAKIFGGCSRVRYPQKSLAFFARSSYETSSFSHRLFPDKKAREYESFILRASGDDQPKTLFRDALTQTLVKELIDVDVQAYRPVVLYINGNYWGIINMREKINEHYAANNFDVDPDKVEVLKRNPYDSWNVIVGSADHYNAMMDYIKSHDITKQATYEYVENQMDIDEYINYQIIQVFFGGRDWPGNNIKFWRSTEAPYNKWRWVLYDLDAHSSDAVGNIMEEATEEDCECTWPNPPWSTYLFRTLLENEEFASKFIEQFFIYTNTHFARERYISTINEIQNHLAPEIPRHIERWGGKKIDNPDNTWMSPIFNSIEEWNSQVQVMRDFAELRHEIVIQQVNDYFGIEGTRQLRLFNTDSTGATLMLGNTPLYDSVFTGVFSSGSKMEIGIVPAPGFIFTHWDKIIYTPEDNVLISKGDEWKYNDKGEWLDYNWNSLYYDDSSWESGNAELGYGDGDETTVVAYGPDPDNKYITTYFRKVFHIEDLKSADLFELQVKRDDAAVIYINNHEVVKENMPQYGHNSNTLAVSAIANEEEKRYLIYNINPELFVEGENIIAVEIHQAGSASSDISFDLQLKASSMIANEASVINSPTVKLEMTENLGLIAHVIPDTDTLKNIFINEVIANNANGMTDEAGEYEDWIEFYNGGSEPVDMAGLMLADTLPVKKVWSFPTARADITVIEPNDYLVVIADNEPDEGPLHATFRLNSLGEELVLMKKLGNDTVIIDQLKFGAQYRDVSLGRFPDGSSPFQLMTTLTPWETNKWMAVNSGILDQVFINEIMASNFDKLADEAGDFEDWIEIYNAGDQEVNLAGYYLSDSLPVTKTWRFPVDNNEVTTIQPDSFIVVFADDEVFEGPLHANFRLSGNGEEVLLLHILADDTTLVDHVVFAGQYNNVSWGRYPDGSEVFKYMPVNTPWHSNFWEFQDTTSVQELSCNDILIYPNPASSVFYIDLNKIPFDKDFFISVYSFTGREILSFCAPGPERIELSLEGYPVGLYLVELKTGAKRYLKKLILK